MKIPKFNCSTLAILLLVILLGSLLFGVNNNNCEGFSNNTEILDILNNMQVTAKKKP